MSGRAATEDQLQVVANKAAAAKTIVAAGNGISVGTPTLNGDGSTTYTVSADTAAITTGTDGKAATTGNTNQVATAQDVVNAINNSGFNITAGGNTVGTPAATTAKSGSTLTLAAGNGLTVQQNVDGNGNQTYTYAVDAQSVVQSAQAPVAYTKADGTKVYKHTDGNFYDAPNGAGNQVAAADVITSLQNAAGSTTAPTTLANVKDNLADTAAAVTNPTGNDRTTLSANKGHNAATVNDVLNAGFTVQGNGVDEDFVTHGDTVNFVNGQGTVANVSSTGGVTTVKFDTPMTYVDTAGTPATTPSNKVNLVGTGGPVTLSNVAAGAVNATSTDAVNGSQLYKTANSTATHLGGGSAVQADGSISAPTYALTNASGAPTNYSNVGDALTALNARTNAANAGWKFQVNSGAAETIKPNDTVGFKDGTNIAITNNGKDITIATKPNLTADSLTINNGPVINGNGISTNGKNIDMGNNCLLYTSDAADE